MIELDKKLFLALNTDFGADADIAFKFISSHTTFALFALIALAIIFKKYGIRTTILIFIMVITTILLSDYVTKIPKFFIEKFRPIYTADIQLLCHFVKNDIPNSLYGTVSGHAATSTALALFLTKIIKNKFFSVFAIIFAITMCYSRIYLACHFPIDLAIGFGFGMIVGYLHYKLYKLITNKYIL